MRKTKIVCTLGPASSEDDIMRQMLLAGLDVARVNFSHGDHEGHGERIDRFRRVRDDLGKAAAVMLEAGQTFTLTTREADGDSSGCSITYKMLPAELKRGDTVLIDDGKI
ncbi:MAG: pyruvate kinase, partial [Firmicutes bacterium]|nr:pyruvate kinase [Bacillota bacterium]